MNTLQQMLFMAPGIIIGLTIHEFSHAAVATSFGDPTPRNQGRLTLNPIKHIDPIGLILLFLIGFGWAKPVQTNPSYFKNKKKSSLFVSLAGPFSNLLVAVLFGIILKLLYMNQSMNGEVISSIYSILFLGTYFNLVLAVFNLLPIPPLDGSKIIFSVLPTKYYFKMIQYERIIQIIMLLLLFTRIIPRLLTPLISMLLNGIFLILNIPM